jgi:transposase
VDGDRTAAAAGAPEAERWAASPASGGTERHHLCARERHPVGDAAAGDGLRVGDEVRAAARLASRRGLDQAASCPARPFGPGERYRWEPCLRGQCLCPGQKGGEETGPNPTDRGRAGCQRPLITDARGIPLAVRLSAAHIHDSRLFEEMIDAVPPIRHGIGRPQRRPAKLQADKGYHFPHCRKRLRRRAIQPRIARHGIESSERLGRHRGVVERTPAWFSRFRRLTIRYEPGADIFEAFHHLAAALISRRFLHRFCYAFLDAVMGWLPDHGRWGGCPSE